MNLSNLTPAKGSVKNRKRIGRGTGSGRGGTSTRGHKGAKSRSGYSKKSGFEGGQMPLQRRIPKFGFNNPDKIVFKPINLDIINNLATEKKLSLVDDKVLLENGLVSKSDKIKVLGRGELKAKLEVKAHSFSESAVKAIENAGGKAIKIA
ncbi:50S ribosomal protein L15 [Sporocytophaga myxococcoides]|uniref:50S ribosomal protein L15 n=1 Tax=Sporocytophaga myxococcoides TaxID=153721 RepID=UPI0003F9E9EE|nr:50S ribosomal protein L15 [Sporocytophaga myxococcoides]